MNSIIIENVRVGISRGGLACAPVEGNAVAEAQIRAGDTVSYHGLVEVYGTLNFYESTESRYDAEIDQDDFDEEFDEDIYDGYESAYCFYQNFEDLKQQDESVALLRKYLLYLICADWDDVEALKKKSIGKSIGDFQIPVSEYEAEYLEDCTE